MMSKTSTTLLATAALIAIAGCAKKKPADLPPPPPSQTAPADTGPTQPTGPVGNVPLPGSRAEFLAQAGSDTVLFGTDSYDLDGEATAILARQVTWLRRNPTIRVTIEGHCDERGTREYNLALGDRRANSAKNYLINAGVDAARLSVVSYGKERPAAEGSDESSWAQNRRAVTVVPQ